MISFNSGVRKDYLLSLAPLHSSLTVSTANTVDLMFNSIKMAKAMNKSQ